MSAQQDSRFAAWVGERLAEWNGGHNGYMAHDVLDDIESKWKEFYGELPEVEW